MASCSNQTCSKCGEVKALFEFNWRSKNVTRHKYCSACQRTASKSHYKRHKRRYFERNGKRALAMISIIRAAKAHPCTDCKRAYPYYVMQFDHITLNKRCDISRMHNCGSTKRLLEEIAKCEVVCANCHAERTHKRRF